MEPADVLITSDAAKLPAEVVALLDPRVPLPADVRFFETRFDVAHVTRGLLMAAGFGLATLLIVPFGVVYLIDSFRDHQSSNTSAVHFGPLGFGLLCGFVTWFLLAGVLQGLNFRARQQRGECTRRGTFLMPGAFVQATEHDTTIIPRGKFRGIAGREIAFELKSERKTFKLPQAFVDAPPADVTRAIEAWAAT